MNENGELDHYDIIVKYNYDVQDSGIYVTEKLSQDNFGEFFEKRRLTHNLKNLMYSYNSNTQTYNLSLGGTNEEEFFDFTGYIKLEMKSTESAGGITIVDEKGNYHDMANISSFGSYEGYVSKFYISPSTGFETFQIISLEYTYDTFSEEVKDFYSNLPENNTNWGELNIDLPNYENPTGGIKWYEPIENDEIDKMEFWKHNFVEQTPDGSTGLVIDVYTPEHVQPSGEIGLSWKGNILPILIHKNDIGKQNTIGPLVRQDGTEIYINLTII